MTRKRAIALSSILTTAALAAVGLLYGNANQLKAPDLPAITPGYYKVTEVVDGDTIQVDMNGTLEKVRFIGVDTPETKKPNAAVQCYGPEASDFTKKALTGKSVRLEADPLDDNRDRYGRLLRYIYLQDGSLLEETLIRQGWGFAYTSFPFQKKTEFIELQNEAQKNKAGLWGVCTPTNTGGRWTSNDL